MQRLIHALENSYAIMPPPVLVELLSSGTLTKAEKVELSLLPRLHLIDGYWERVGALRCAILKQKKKSGMADAMIAQLCIDHNIPLITNDYDFRNYLEAGLVL